MFHAGLRQQTTQFTTSSSIPVVLRLHRTASDSDAASPPFTELQHLNGYISKLGVQYGVATPLNDALVALVETKCEAAVERS